MKKIIKLSCLLLICSTLSGCFKRDNLEGVEIYTTIYPVEYITERLYGENSKIYSIYPNEIDVNTYELTDKQIENYSEKPIFIYTGVTKEKEIARKFLNKNDKIQIIDASYGLKYVYEPEELWLSPNNYLMLATNIKNNLQDEITNKFIKEEIEENFRLLEEELSLIDAELRRVGNEAIKSEKNTLIVNNNLFNFLENYGFNIIDISKENISLTESLDKVTNPHLIIRDDLTVDEETKKIIEKEKLNVITVDIMSVLDEQQRKDNETYLTIINLFIEDINSLITTK